MIDKLEFERAVAAFEMLKQRDSVSGIYDKYTDLLDTYEDLIGFYQKWYATFENEDHDYGRSIYQDIQDIKNYEKKNGTHNSDKEFVKSKMKSVIYAFEVTINKAKQKLDERKT